MTVVELLRKHCIALDNIAPGRHYTTCPQCSKNRRKPGHKDAKCLGVTIERDGAHWGCNHCGWTGPEKGGGNGGGLVVTYDYVDADGTLLFQKVRKPPGSPGDRFFVHRPDGCGGWIKNLKDVPTPRPLYRWPEIVKAMKEDHREIAIVEGEKDADNLWLLGIPATTNFDGTTDITKNPKAQPKWKTDYSEQLRGARIIVFNDNDPPGYAHADTICKLSLGVAERVRRLDLAQHWPDIPKGGDVSDWLAVGGEHTPERLRELIVSAPDFASASGSTAEMPFDDDAEIGRLAKLSAFDYERGRAEAAKRLGVRAAMLDRLVAAKRSELGFDADGRQGHAVSLPEPEPWPEPVDGVAVLSDLAAAIRRYVVMTESAADAIALWVTHSFLAPRFLVSPRLALLSPTKQCGKTTLIDVLPRLVCRPLPTINATVAAIFRIVEELQPTLLLDEADTFFNSDNEEMRGLLNGGYRQGATVLRVEGDDHRARAYRTYTPTIIAAIGSLPATIVDRALVITLTRRKPDEHIEPFRLDRTEALDILARRIARWSKDNGDAVAAHEPDFPKALYNRSRDNWKALFQISDVVGGPWPQRARAAAMAGAPDIDEASLIELLLGDVRDVFNEQQVDPIAGAALIEELCKITPRPWSEYGRNGKPITANKLARLLKPLGIAPQVIRLGNETPRGYQRHQFKEAFERFLAPEGGSNRNTVTNVDRTGTSGPSQSATAENVLHFEKSEKANNDAVCCTVAVQKGGTGPEGLSERTIDDLAAWYEQTHYDRRDEPEIAATLDRNLRGRLRDEFGVLREFVETEAKRVIERVFAVVDRRTRDALSPGP
jgi:Protein of unknown function (DUF3631)